MDSFFFLLVQCVMFRNSGPGEFDNCIYSCLYVIYLFCPTRKKKIKSLGENGVNAMLHFMLVCEWESCKNFFLHSSVGLHVTGHVNNHAL